ncbi:MAG: hypothetical protein LIO62_02465 [Clostridiales bacterium]|nr:hypothetical protein [Clostridiales bacterium]
MDEEIIEETLDSPLVVHKKSDASYQETAGDLTMNSTHSDDSSDEPTLERHRFKKEKKNNSWKWVLFAFIAIAVAVTIALYQSGKINFGEKESTTTTKKSYTTQAANEFEGIITIKGTYIFFEGEELDDISQLERKIKYLSEGTSFVIQDESADSNFLNYEVLSLLSEYNISYEIMHIVSSGLVSKYENITTTTTTTTTKKSSDSKTTAKKTTTANSDDE